MGWLDREIAARYNHARPGSVEAAQAVADYIDYYIDFWVHQKKENNNDQRRTP